MQHAGLPRLLTTAQIAELLNVAPHTLAAWRSEGNFALPFVKIGRAVRYRMLDVELYLEPQTHRGPESEEQDLEYQDDISRSYRAISFADLQKMELPPHEFVVDPWLRRRGVAMVHANRGVGKTIFALELTMVVASGTEFLNWQIPQARSVAYLDGDMSLPEMQHRSMGWLAISRSATSQAGYLMVAQTISAEQQLYVRIATATFTKARMDRS